MNSKEKKSIKEVIEHILKFRTKEIFDNENIYTSTHDYKEKDNLNSITTEKYDKPLIKLNNILNQEERYKEILEIEKHMMKIQSKKIITTKEYKDIYDLSIKHQENYRNRIKDPLPFNQLVEGGKITYKVKLIEEWQERNQC